MAFISGNFRSSRAVAAQARVRQYYGANGPEYYPLLDWQDVGGSGEQELQIPIDRERVASGGRTYVEWRFARRGGGKFDEQSLVSLEALAVDRTRWGWYTRTVLSCEQEDNYRYGYNGQEKVNEISGKGAHNTALFWEYDTRLGRRWNLDPVDQISISNYAANENNPILMSDPNGDIPGDGCCGGLVNTLTAVGGAMAATIDNILPTTGNPVREWSAPSDPLLREHFDRGAQAGDVASVMGGAMVDNIGTGLMSAGARVTVGTGGAGAEAGVPMVAGGAALKVAGAWMFAKGVSNLAKSTGQQTQGGNSSSASTTKRTGNKLAPNDKAVGDHTVFRRGNPDGKGKVYKYETYEKTRSGHWNPKKRYDAGQPDGSPGAPHKGIPTPHVKEGGKTRPAALDDIPKN